MKKSFSLIEVLVFVTILSLFFVAAMSIVTFSLKTMKTNEHKILASHYTEEAVEWVKGQKEDSWVNFVSYDTVAGASTYCINNLNFSTPAACDGYALGSPPVFKRQLLLENIPDSAAPNQVNVTVTVYWLEGQTDQSVSVKTILKRLE